MYTTCTFFSNRFVTLDMVNSSKDLLSIMLDLKSKKICNETIKARLKAQTMVSSSSIGSSPKSYKKNINYRPNYHSSRYSFNNRNGVGRKTGGVGGPSSSSPRGGYYNSSNSNYSNQIYSGDRVNYTSKKYSRGTGNANSAYRKQYQYQSRDGKGIDHTDSGENNKAKKVVKIQPPPPVGKEHYPSLNGELGDSSPISITKTGMEEELGKKSPNVVKSCVGGAYAAALLKDAPSTQPSTSNMKRPSKTKSAAHVPSSSKALGKVRQKK